MHTYKLYEVVAIVEGQHKGKVAAITEIHEGAFGKKWFDVAVVVGRKPIMAQYFSPEDHKTPAGEVQDGWKDIYETVRKRESDVTPRA